MPSIEVKKNWIFVRRVSPSFFEKRSMRWVKKPRGVSFIYAKLKPEHRVSGMSAWDLQAYRFDRRSYTVAQARQWVEKYGRPYAKNPAVKTSVSKSQIARKLDRLYKLVHSLDIGDYATLKAVRPSLHKMVKKLEAMYQRAENPAMPKKPVLIYDKVEFIGATKGRSSHFAGKKFIHKFKKNAKMFGMPDGSIVIK